MRLFNPLTIGGAMLHRTEEKDVRPGGLSEHVGDVSNEPLPLGGVRSLPREGICRGYWRRYRQRLAGRFELRSGDVLVYPTGAPGRGPREALVDAVASMG